MYTRKGKKIIGIVVVLIILLVVLGVGGFFVYTQTDLLKPNQDVFFKYSGKMIESTNQEANNQWKEIEKTKQTTPYDSEGKLTVDVEADSESMELMSIDYETSADKSKGDNYVNLTIGTNNQDIFNVEYAQNNNIYALKSNEIVNAFVGIENENLKVLAQKLGITDVEAIPDSIEQIDYAELFNITEAEKEHIKETYVNALRESINKEKFTKQKKLTINKDGVNYNATGYRLDLTAEDLKNIEISLLQTLKQDSITLNLISTKIKMLGDNEELTDISKITEAIQKYIDELNEQTNTDSEGISIIHYVDKGELLTTEVILANEMKYTIYTSGSSKIIEMDNLSTTSSFEKVKMMITETQSAQETSYTVNISIDSETKITASAKISGSGTSSVTTSAKVSIESSDATVTANYSGNIKFGNASNIVELDRNTNCVVLNDYDTEQLQYLVGQIVQRTSEVISQKMDTLGVNNVINSAYDTITSEDYQRQLEEQERQLDEAEGLIDQQMEQYGIQSEDDDFAARTERARQNYLIAAEEERQAIDRVSEYMNQTFYN